MTWTSQNINIWLCYIRLDKSEIRCGFNFYMNKENTPEPQDGKQGA